MKQQTYWIYRVTFFSWMLLAMNSWSATVQPAVTTEDLNNPHKGFMLWGTDYADGAPNNYHGATVYHVYMPWREIETSDQVFDWVSFEANHLTPILDDHPEATFVLRPVADYPEGASSGITLFYTGGEPTRDYPKFLEEAPLNIGFANYVECDGDGPGRTPDWNNPQMITQMVQFVSALQAQFDGDPRITCIQVGLLGLWGEWHQSGCDAVAPNNAAKEAVRDHYASVFTNTLLQTRYPRDPDSIGVNFGFHEDYFPSFTDQCNFGFPLCDDSGDWNFYYGFQNVNSAAATNWQSNPISGESPLTSQKNAWVNDTADILSVLKNNHFSFLGPAGKHESSGNTNALQSIKRTMGYNYHIQQVDWPDQVETNLSFSVTLVMTNSGAAPCYHDFPVELSLCDASDNPVWTDTWTFDLRNVLPGASFSSSESFSVSGVSTGSYSLRLAILNPRFGGQPGVLIQSAGRDSHNRYAVGDVEVRPAGTLDLDSDGLPDAWEVLTMGSTNYPAGGDVDGDGLSNEEEFIAGTDPTNSLSRLTVNVLRRDSEVLVETFALVATGLGYSGSTRYYEMEYRTNLLTGVWSGVAGYSNILGAGQTIQLTNSLEQTGFFRVKAHLE